MFDCIHENREGVEKQFVNEEIGWLNAYEAKLVAHTSQKFGRYSVSKTLAPTRRVVDIVVLGTGFI